ncbi:MAG TPA: endonuclease/exonuclease/phosphatase family protein [Pyrinomonadaceae bacterium]|nr:endonuclease/exonuclease/phosphatase family protein [Pyrinomonadaceae bacterium]
MHRRLGSLFAILLGFFAVTTSIQQSAQAATSTPLRVLSWNIQFGQGTDGVTNYDRIATWLARMNPDLIALCEVPPDKIPTLVTLLNQKTGRTWNSHFVPKANGISEGNLILSKFAFAAVGSRFLSYTRSIAQVTVNAGGRNINFFATHLDHTSSALRQTEVSELLSWTAGFASPQIIAGDMNAANDTPEVLSLLGVYRDSWVDALNSGKASAYPDNPVWMNTRTRRWRIDFILFTANLTTMSVNAANIPDTRDLSNTNVVNRLGTADDSGVRPSDHNLVVTDFDVWSDATPTPTPTPMPTPPVLLTQPNTSRAVAIHSTLFNREPFTLKTPINLGSDQRTRIMLFTTNLELLAGETASAITVRAVDARGNSYTLPVEQVLKFPNLNWLTTLVVRMPDDSTISGDLLINVSIRGAVSNNALIAIKLP